MRNFSSKPKVNIRPEAYNLVRSFSKNRRNEIRGALSQIQLHGFGEDSLSIIRNNSTSNDMVTAANLLEAPFGLRSRKIHGLTQKDLWTTYEVEDQDLELEVAYACGFLNAWPRESEKAIGTIKIISGISRVAHADAAGALYECAKEWGASNYLAFKIVYLKHITAGNSDVIKTINQIDEIVGNQESPALQYSAMEHMKESLSIFSIAKRHINTSRQTVGKRFRRAHNLNNLVSTPFSNTDAAAFLHRAVESSLIDTTYALWILLNLNERFPDAANTIRSSLDDNLSKAMDQARLFVAGELIPDIEENTETESPQDRSLNFYKKSSAFLEYPSLSKFRNDLDRVIGYRLIIPLTGSEPEWPSASYDQIETILKSNERFDIDLHGTTEVKIDTFYRTYLFLRYIQEREQLAFLDESSVKFIFNNTTGLDALLTETELQSMHLNASEETRPLVSVLALALFRGRSSDPDIDFEYRHKLERYIQEYFSGDIPAFIQALTSKNPQIASYLAASLDDSTLQKMYSLVNSPQEAGAVRKQILTSVGFALNRIEYIIEAEAIETRSKVSGLRKYFDGSRMFVDSIAMRDWLEANPSAYTQHYKELLPKLVARLAAIADYKDKNTGEVRKIPVVEVSNTVDHIVKQIAQEAFREFCVNAEFGIESYLGRRIRHNTLHGVMIDPIDAIIDKPSYHPVITKTRFGDSIHEWKSAYRLYIDRMRKEFLQFYTEGKPAALFHPELDFSDSATNRNVSNLTQGLKLSGPEMLPDLVIAFCWEQISPQLENAAREIKIKMSGDVKQSLESLAGKFSGPEQQRIVAELNEAIDGVFSRVASWFRRPDTGFVSATLNDMCRIIDIEFGREDHPTIVSGNLLETQYYGISVHRIYDCLAVVIQNAIKHGVFYGDITVSAKSTPIEATNLHNLTISVLSRIDEEDTEGCVALIQAALDSTETGRDMVTEGYSGLKKLKYITKLNLGKHSVDFASVGDEIEITFTLKVETSSNEDVSL